MGFDPLDATDEEWVGALQIADAFDDLKYIRKLLENTAKNSQRKR